MIAIHLATPKMALVSFIMNSILISFLPNSVLGGLTGGKLVYPDYYNLIGLRHCSGQSLGH